MDKSTFLNHKKIAFFLFFSISVIFSLAQEKPVDLVYPHLDAANSRWFFFSSACRPFGLVNLSPDNELGGAWGSGYRYNTNEIKGFSHVHAWQLSAVSVLPVNGSAQDLKNNYFSAFSHEKEVVAPGYHKVELDRYKIKAELTSTTRVGFHKYTYENQDQKGIIVKLTGPNGPCDLTKGKIEKVNNREFSGYVVNDATRRRPNPTPVFFYIELDTKVKNLITWEGTNTNENSKGVEGAETGALITFENKTNKPVLMKVGISYTNAEEAKKNIQAELNHWDFEQVVADSKEEWNSWLSKIEVSGGTQNERIRFYTDLWHGLQGRRIISDASGAYSDFTGPERKIKQIPRDKNGTPKFNHHNFDAFWGAQWTINTLWPLVYPKVAGDFCNSMLLYYNDGGLIPRGPSGGNYTYVMVGASTTPFVVSTWMKGIHDFDINLAYEGLKKNHMPGGIMGKAGYEHNTSEGGGIEEYIEKGYVPFPRKPHIEGFHKDGAGMTMEYAFQDWTLAQLAKKLGKTEDYKTFLKRSNNWKNLFDTSYGFIRPKGIDGSWKTPYDPYQYQNDGFVESNAAQMTWYVPQDFKGLAELMGGEEAMANKLNNEFTIAQAHGFTSGKKHADETLEQARRIPINYGNQPSMQTAFIFNTIGVPWLTQKWSRAVIDSVYTGVSPFVGYNGDEDQGLMGTLAVLMKIGLFQLDGGTTEDPVYLIGSPVFDEINISLDNQYYQGKNFKISTENNSKKNIYVQSVTLNGNPLNRMYLLHSEITKGGELHLLMGPEPNKKLK
ncbi:glycoside hydrolase family 92 protein [Maribellus comscasis]|uniref:Glycoside hydrolase family 92 protein n=1 Tax=Maribellus comscasis TaxID=2681766 RepID=A0A6I6K2G4_9BACT|nr:GH92 family glycosyl hydrolase [Maribellus comscasis]QGY46622.1 glycoside hydrolase family 92 protein [Maribellus comscasis]